MVIAFAVLKPRLSVRATHCVLLSPRHVIMCLSQQESKYIVFDKDRTSGYFL